MDDAETYSSLKEHSTTTIVITNDEGNESNKTVSDNQRYPVSDKENSLDSDGKELTVACIDGSSANNQPHIAKSSSSKEKKPTNSNFDKENKIHAPPTSDQDSSIVDQDKGFNIATSVITDPMNMDQDVFPSDQYTNSYLTIAQHTEDPKEDSGTYADARQDQDEKLDHDVKHNQADVDSKFDNSHAEFNPDTGHTEFEVVGNKAKLNKYLEHKCMHFQPNHQIEIESSQLTGLESSLQDFTNSDILDDDNKFFCNTCTENSIKTQSVTATEALCLVSKQITIHHLPQILILHVKRFTIESDGVFKDSGHISFPYKLNMSPYCTSECLKNMADDNNEIWYGLYAVVVHDGYTLKHGHYFAYVRRRPLIEPTNLVPETSWMYDQSAAEGEVWYYTSDLTVHKCNEGFEEVSRQEAYMLFYELLPKTIVTI